MPTDNTLQDRLAEPVRTMQIISAALIMGPIAFAIVVLAIGDQGPGDPAPIQGQAAAAPAVDPLQTIGLVVGLVAIFAQNVLGRVVSEAGVKAALTADGDRVESLAGAYQTGLIVALAVNEGAAFLNLIAYMISPSVWNLAMAGLLIVSNAVKFPTVGRVATWIEMRERRIEDEKAFVS